MRIVIDLQGAQSESRFRGIGRYSLALALGVARNAGEHEVWLVLNAALGAAIADIRTAFAGLVPPERIRVFDIAGASAEIDTANCAQARSNEALREYFIERLAPDAVLVTSLFEGFVDDAVVSVGAFAGGSHTAVVLYDLIPFLNPAAYLGTDAQRSYYERKIASLRRAGLLLAISDYSRQEAIDALDLAPGQVVAISTAVDDSFTPGAPDPERLAALRSRCGLTGPFVLYAPGGFDTRKNIDGLITAYSQLPAALRDRHQLVIASKLPDGERAVLERHARDCGVAPGALVLTGYVSDADLIELYRACALFVFPSKHEGFGLPALEAMACGAIVIGSSATSVPEVIGCDEALFDPADPAAIAACIADVLQDPARQQRLREHGARQARAFSWDHTARRALAGLEAHHAALAPAAATPLPGKRRIAFVSPMPPERTGVADYAVRILPTLLPWFEVELVTHQERVTLPPELAHLTVRDAAWLRTHGADYDHIVYQFGNSPFHSHMVPLLETHPGVVVLHDFFLSSMLSYEQMTGAMPGLWSRALFDSHGYAALRAIDSLEAWERGKDDYPSNLSILRNASHVIVHSEYARQLARQWYGPEAGRGWSPAQLPRAVPPVHDRQAARAALGIDPDAFVVCNFGFVAPTKHCLALLQAWVASSLHGDRHCELVFVGANHGGDYGQQITDTIAAAGSGRRIRVSGWTSDEDYLRYLQAADVGVQLRTSSRGETSGTVLDCMIYGLPTVINANGAMAEFPHDAVWMLPDLFNQQQLVTALETLRADSARRDALRRSAAALMAVRNSPERCGRMYKDALDREWHARGAARGALIERLLDAEPDDAQLQVLARCIGRMPESLQPRQLLIDVSNIVRQDHRSGIERVVRHQLLELLQLPQHGVRVEPVYLRQEGGHSQYRYARGYGASL
ncbi:MAG: glycosyltransferase, partial [Massilia sp.]